jgi:TPP-dependent pyruvate/acetoin dehydrogenase alpha subunit
LLIEHGGEADPDEAERAAVKEMDAVVEQAKAAPYPDPSTVLEDVGG